jgi:predicted dehydrogenase
MKPLRTAILGCGGFAKRHAENIVSMPEHFDLVAFCDINRDHAEAYAKKYAPTSAKVYTDFCPMFDEVKLDLVIICLPPYGHTNEVETAALRGIHILIEKPIALTIEQAWKMVEAVESARIKTQVGFMFRFGGAITEIKNLIESGKAGPVGLMSARYFCNSLHANWWRMRDKSGGQLVEQVIHMVDLMRFLMGAPQTVYSLQNNLFHQEIPDYTIEDVSGTVIGFRNDGIGVIYATNGGIPGKWINDYHLVAKNLTAEFSDANHCTITNTRDSNLQELTISSEQDYYRLELLDLLKAIETDGQTQIPLREGALSLNLALAATRSAQSGTVINLTDER